MAPTMLKRCGCKFTQIVGSGEFTFPTGYIPKKNYRRNLSSIYRYSKSKRHNTPELPF